MKITKLYISTCAVQVYSISTVNKNEKKIIFVIFRENNISQY